MSQEFEKNMSQEIVETLSDNLRTISVDSADCKDFRKGKGEASFDEIIGHIEDLLMEDDFQQTQQRFLDKYWNVFEPIEENKLIYMDIFEEYNKAIESYIDRSLKKAIPLFNMESLLKQLSERGAELDGEVFEVLSTFTDFLAFKEMFLDYRAVKEGRVQDLSTGISITSVKSTHSDSDDPTG